MKTMKTLSLAFTFGLFCTCTAHAHWAGFYASYWDTGDFGDTQGVGVVGHWDIHDFISVEGRGAWYIDFGDPEGEEIEPAWLGIGPAVRIGLNEDWTGYGSVVGSVFVFNRDVVVDGEELIDDAGADFGVIFTCGLRANIHSNWSFFAEAQYTIVTVDTKGVHGGEIVDDEIDLGGFGINLGIGYSW